MKRKLLGIMTAAALSLSLVACSGGGTTPQSSTTTKTETTTETTSESVKSTADDEKASTDTTKSETKSTTTTTPKTNTIKKTDSRAGLCQFKNSDGSQTCTNKATHGKLCDYHFNMLNDTYNSLVGD